MTDKQSRSVLVFLGEGVIYNAWDSLNRKAVFDPFYGEKQRIILEKHGMQFMGRLHKSLLLKVLINDKKRTLAITKINYIHLDQKTYSQLD